MRIFLIRHADPYYPDDSLTPAGQQEALALADFLAMRGVDELYSSPRGRARLTAQPAADLLGLPLVIEPWTNELGGLSSAQYGHALWDIDGAVLRDPRVLGDLNHWERVPPLDHPLLADHLHAIQAGSDAFLARQGFVRAGTVYRVERPAGQPNNRKIALVAHLGFGLTWLALLLDIPLPLMWAGFFLQPSSVTTILFDERQPGIAVPRVTSLGDLSHLARAGLPASNTGIIANRD